MRGNGDKYYDEYLSVLPEHWEMDCFATLAMTVGRLCF